MSVDRRNVTDYFRCIGHRQSHKICSTAGHRRVYDGHCFFTDYKTNHGLLLFPVSPDDSRLPRKERVLGVILNGEARAYRFQQNGSNIDLLTDELSSKSLSIIHSKDKNILIAFENELEDGTEVSNLSAVQNQLPVIMIDDEGNNYNVFGEVTQGPQQGEKLKSVTSMMAYWFAWGTFYPNSSIAN